MPHSTIIIGIGNPLLTDDGVGLAVARRLEDALRGREAVTVACLSAGGLRLVEAMAGHDRAILIDAIVTSSGKPGAVYRLTPRDLGRTHNVPSTHDGSLPAAIELARLAGLKIPADIRIWAVEAGDVATFSESLTPAVAQAVPRVVQTVLQHLERRQNA